MRKIIYKIEKSLIGKIQLQPLYESLHRISIRGMNYMQSQDINKTGEINAMKYALSQHKNNDSTVLFDVGANNGQFVSYMSDIFPDNFNIFSFEPSGKAFDILTSKINKPNIALYNHGFSSVEKEIELYHSGKLVGTAYPIGESEVEPEKISVKRIDDFCQKENIEAIYYLKVDVEGAEFDVLKGATELLRNNKVKFIQFEYGPNCMVSRIFLKDFFELLINYDIYRILKNGIRRLQYNEVIEIPLTGNFLAELKNG